MKKRKNRLEIGESYIQYDWYWSEEEGKTGYYLYRKDNVFGPYDHVYDAIEDALQFND